jgi:uncharacterized protein (TIGR03000 family)
MISPSLVRRAFFPLLCALVTAPLVWSQAPDTQERRATLTVRVHPDAKLTVDGVATKKKGDVRVFHSPPLEPGKSYFYTFVAEWMPGNNYETWTVKRKVTFKAGDKVEVDLRKPDPKQGDSLFIIYVPTPPEIVDAMMKLANVGKDDVVYDLGCGDGRIVITAVKKYNAKRGVGVDLKEERLLEAEANAKREGVEKKVEFRKGDVLKIKDLSEATVVMLYLSDDLNVLLRPILQEQLKPGARIVSHRFTMGDWKPDKTEKLDVQEQLEEDKLIHLWTIKKREEKGKNQSGK